MFSESSVDVRDRPGEARGPDRIGLGPGGASLRSAGRAEAPHTEHVGGGGRAPRLEDWESAAD